MIWYSDTTILEYVPIIVEAICNDGYSIQVSDSGVKLAVGDILVTSAVHKAGSWQLYVTEVVCLSDLFEDLIILDISAVTNTTSLWAVKDLLDIGDELKLLASAH